MAQHEGRNKVTIEFHLTPDEQLHVFAQWCELNPKEKLEEMTSRRYWSVLRDHLAAHGWAAVNARLPEQVEIKKIDYKAILKGVIRH
jgi:hypothetical protein